MNLEVIVVFLSLAGVVFYSMRPHARGGKSRYRRCRYCRRLLSFQTPFLKKDLRSSIFRFWFEFCYAQFLGLFITIFHRPYLLDIYNRILVSRQINAKHQSLKAFSRKWCLKNVLSGKRLSGNRLVRETSVRESSCPGNVCPGNVLSGKRLSGKVTVRETTAHRSVLVVKRAHLHRCSYVRGRCPFVIVIDTSTRPRDKAAAAAA